jgi:hypothetical protein
VAGLASILSPPQQLAFCHAQLNFDCLTTGSALCFRRFGERIQSLAAEL